MFIQKTLSTLNQNTKTPFDVIKIRQDFPIFNRQINGHPLAYLDNSATTQKPKVVVEAIEDYYFNHNANINRGVHMLAEESTNLYEDSRHTIAQFIGARDEELIFIRNTTEGLNLVAYSWAMETLKAGDEIILTQMEHHANIVPWQFVAQKTGAKLKFVQIDEEGKLVLSRSLKKDQISGGLQDLLSPKTKVISLVHISNVLGTINPVKEIIKQVKKYNKEIVCVIDGAQSVPHMSLSVKDLGCDFLSFSGHKMCGPMGIGVLWGRKELLEKMPPFLGGGDMISAVYWDHSEFNKLPEKFEAGTPNVAGAVGLAAAVKYLQTAGLDKIHNYETELIDYLLSRLQEFPDLYVLGPKEARARGGLVTFELKTVHAHDVAAILNSLGVAVRSGHHCAMPLHHHLNIKASVRASVYLYNTKEEIDRLIEGLGKVSKVFGK